MCACVCVCERERERERERDELSDGTERVWFFTNCRIRSMFFLSNTFLPIFLHWAVFYFILFYLCY